MEAYEFIGRVVFVLSCSYVVGRIILALIGKK